MIRSWRTAAVALGAGVVGALAFVGPAAAYAGPAAADVTVSPSAAPRGGPAELAFHVTDDRPGAYTTQIELDAPEATPIAEIYPMSADDWAPRVATRQLSQPVELIHGTTTTEVVSSITWLRVTGPPTGPAKPAELRVSLGPMPTTETVAFTVVQTYSDGTVVRWADAPAADGSKPAHPAPVVTLVDDPAASAGHDGHGTSDGTAAGTAGSGGNSGGTGGTYGILAAGLLVGLVVGVGIDGWLIVRAIRRNAAKAGARSTKAAVTKAAVTKVPVASAK
jgi:uncharacterized protein YcnI